MWKCGQFIFSGKVFRYEAKVFDYPSKFGSDGGRVSKLYIYSTSGDENMICDIPVVIYDRYWELQPKTEFYKEAMKFILNLFN